MDWKLYLKGWLLILYWYIVSYVVTQYPLPHYMSSYDVSNVIQKITNKFPRWFKSRKCRELFEPVYKYHWEQYPGGVNFAVAFGWLMKISIALFYCFNQIRISRCFWLHIWWPYPLFIFACNISSMQSNLIMLIALITFK